MTNKQVTYPARTLSVRGDYDVIICGGGPAGCAAALSSARRGAKVLLIEGQGQLGGTGTSGLVSHWLGGRKLDGRWVVGGIFRELATEGAQAGIALLPVARQDQTYTPFGWYLGLSHGVPIDPFAMAGFLDRKLLDAGVDLLLHTQAVDVLREGDRLTHVVFYNKSGLQASAGRAFVDATGDADLANRAGCDCRLGRDEDHATAPASVELQVYNVDQAALSAYIHEHDSPRFLDEIADLRQRGEWDFSVDRLITVQLTEPGTLLVNTNRLCDVDGTDGDSVTDAMIRGREENRRLMDCLRKHFPGFADVRIRAIANCLGVRETRRIRGEMELTVEDIQQGRSFPDIIGLSSYGWDLPDPKRPSHQPMHGKPRPPVSRIPYRIMIPRGVENLICPGRAVSVERDVMGPLRVMAPVMAMGEAAGLSAVNVARKATTFRGVDPDALRKQLLEQNAILEWNED